MNKPITLFSGYSQKENRVTNYCLLLLKMFYEENPKYLGEVLASLVGEWISSKVGVNFRQQERKDKSIPDGLIIQEQINIYIETKIDDWFYDDQLERHLNALVKESHGVKILLALGNFETDTSTRFIKIEELCRNSSSGISFAAVSFEDFLNALEGIKSLPKNLIDAVFDFRNYLDELDQLASWKNRLDVVNCSGSTDNVIEGQVYICPAKGGAYNHARCKYFGVYQNKNVKYIALIEAVVDVDPNSKSILKWSNINNKSKDALCKLAEDKVKKYGFETESSQRVFLLGELYVTNFVKNSPGGMFGSKQYFDISNLEKKINSAQELANELKDKLWSDLKV